MAKNKYKKIIVALFILTTTSALADSLEFKGALKLTDRSTVEKIAALPLEAQAKEIKKNVAILLFKSGHKEIHHFFDFLAPAEKTVDDLSDLEGFYGKVNCSDPKSIWISDDAPPSLLLHEYIHFLQERAEPRWCELNGKVLEIAEKREQALLFHRFEFEVYQTLWSLREKLSLNFEDRLLTLEGLRQEDTVLSSAGISALSPTAKADIQGKLDSIHSQVNALTWLTRTHAQAEGVLQKMEILNLRGCVENTPGAALSLRINQCMQRRCEAVGLSCKDVTEGELAPFNNDLLKSLIYAWQKPHLLTECTVSQLKDELLDHVEEPSDCWTKWYTVFGKEKREPKPLRLDREKLKARYGLSTLAVDKKITFEKVTLPESLLQKGYCYVVFEKVSGLGGLPINQFAYAALGVMVERGQLAGYRDWLKTEEGRRCGKLVHVFTKNNPDLFTKPQLSTPYLFVVNPVGALRGGVKTFDNVISTEINHERLHLVFNEDPKVQEKIQGEWNELSSEAKETFKHEHPQYDFSNSHTLLQEYYAFSRQ